MNKQTTETAFETYAEQVLLDRSGWSKGTVAEWGKQHALFPQRIFDFLQSTQPELWDSMHKLHGDGLQSMLVQTLVKELEVKGTLHVLRHGFKFYGKTFRLAYFKPAHGLAPDVIERYEQNQLTVTRQVPCHPKDYTGPDSSEYTEPQMNIDPVSGKPISETQLRDRFSSDDYQVLLVANKYQTGFDQPLLMAMYVDKRLDGVQAVQTLSRLNRKIPGKDEPFVLDFRNETEDIKKAFKPYFDATLLEEKGGP